MMPCPGRLCNWLGNEFSRVFSGRDQHAPLMADWETLREGSAESLSFYWSGDGGALVNNQRHHNSAL